MYISNNLNAKLQENPSISSPTTPSSHSVIHQPVQSQLPPATPISESTTKSPTESQSTTPRSPQLPAKTTAIVPNKMPGQSSCDPTPNFSTKLTRPSLTRNLNTRASIHYASSRLGKRKSLTQRPFATTRSVFTSPLAFANLCL